MRCLLLILIALLAVKTCLCTTDSTVQEKSVATSLFAKWSDTPLLLEAAEFVHRNNPNFFWPLVNEISNSVNFEANQQKINTQTYYQQVIKTADKFLSKLQSDLLRLSLSIRTYSPAVEMSRQLAEEARPNNQCLTFIEVHGRTTCNLDELSELIGSADSARKPTVFQFDKKYPVRFTKVSTPDVIVVLYSQLGTTEFTRFHTAILAIETPLDYIFRHNYQRPEVANQIGLSGYGVELDIKKQEYKNKDDAKVKSHEGGHESAQSGHAKDDSMNGFVFAKLRQLHPEVKDQLDEFRAHLVESTLELAPLKAWQMQDLSLQAAQRVLEADPADALTVLEDLAQNFPIRARGLSKVQVSSELRKAFKAQRQRLENSLQLEAGSGSVFVNGLAVTGEVVDVFSLSALLRKEAQLMEGLHAVGLNPEQIGQLVRLDTGAKSSGYGVDIRDTCVQWLNDLEKDRKYNHWTKNMQEILRPTYPGMTRSIARNFFNLVFMLDPAKAESHVLLKTAESFFVNDIPIRIGFVFVTSDAEAMNGFENANAALFRAHNYIKSTTNSNYKALSFITDVYSAVSKNQDVTADKVIKEFKKRYPKEVHNLDNIFGTDSDYDEGRKLTMEYYRKVGIRSLPQVFVNGYPLTDSELEGDSFEEAVINKVMQLTHDIQMAVYKGELTDSMNLLDWLMNKDEIMPRLNPRILNPQRNFLALNEFVPELNTLTYITKSSDSLNPLTFWQVSDPDTNTGRQLLLDSLTFQQSSNINSRLAIFLQKRSEESDVFKKAIGYAITKLDSVHAVKFITKILRESVYLSIQSGAKLFSEVLKEQDIPNLDEEINNFDIKSLLAAHRSFLSTHTPFKDPSHVGLVANGWVIGPFESDESFIDSDFSLMERFVVKQGLKSVKMLVNKWDLAQSEDKIFMISALLGKYASDEKRQSIPKLTDGVVSVKPQRTDQPFFDIVVILDPLTRFGQQVSTVLKVLARVTNVNLSIYFNCREKLSALPLNSFYRYVLDEELRFRSDDLEKPLAYFYNMPQTPVLTMNVLPPESWMIEPVRSPYDLDNIFLLEVEGDNVYGDFELKHIVMEGHAYDILNGQPPRGLQFNLGTASDPFKYDTIVMANLGYFQLKSSPGMWYLQLREGRSKDIYEIVSHENTESETKRSQNIVIVLDSFEGKIIKVKVSKKMDKLSENLLDDGKDEQDKEEGLWSSLTSKFTGKSEDTDLAKAKDKENVLNIFSLASGHLYERLMRIMMLTVLRNTQAKVKFWFLSNYLSPQFTSFLPYYAEKYNFDYELVQYKWPRWLHHESEKQRIIWGYKILFLDVLFPLNVEKIIFVDADQIVKADLTELRDIDLKGAPYGYTPFCDSKKEMEGFRFWKQGYWSMHLAHRKYHISALYVVDLKKFRKIAAGDRLRGQYQGLSQDPNSLANLDQDLPNNMIHQVNIFSLPQEWLYCDTWCSSDTLSKAKTIDLCNNPQTKEPKLTAAKRIVPEWTDYDNEIKRVMEEWHLQQQNGSDRLTKTPGSSSGTTPSSGDVHEDL